MGAEKPRREMPHNEFGEVMHSAMQLLISHSVFDGTNAIWTADAPALVRTFKEYLPVSRSRIRPHPRAELMLRGRNRPLLIEFNGKIVKINPCYLKAKPDWTDVSDLLVKNSCTPDCRIQLMDRCEFDCMDYIDKMQSAQISGRARVARLISRFMLNGCHVFDTFGLMHTDIKLENIGVTKINGGMPQFAFIDIESVTSTARPPSHCVATLTPSRHWGSDPLRQRLLPAYGACVTLVDLGNFVQGRPLVSTNRNLTKETYISIHDLQKAAVECSRHAVCFFNAAIMILEHIECAVMENCPTINSSHAYSNAMEILANG